MGDVDARTRSAAELTTALRAWLHARREPSDVLAAAMAYELAALVAKDAPTPGHAFNCLDAWLRVMKWQIHECGVGREHP